CFEALNEGFHPLRPVIVERKNVIPGRKHSCRKVELELLEELGGNSFPETLADQRSVLPSEPSGCENQPDRENNRADDELEPVGEAIRLPISRDECRLKYVAWAVLGAA